MAVRIGRRFVGTAFIAAPFVASAQERSGWPDRPIRLIYPFGAGLGESIVRLMCEQLRPLLGQTVVVDPRPGANTMIGAEATARAPKDGYTIGWVAINTFAINPHLQPNITYRLEDFTPISLTYRGPNAFAVTGSLPITDMASALDYIRRNPGAGVGTVGNGSSPHILMERMNGLTGVQLENIAYRGEQGIITDLISGRLPFYCSSVNGLLQYLDGGQVRMLAHSGAERLPFLPDVPTLREAVHPELVHRNWHGVVVPAGVPLPIVSRLADSIATVLRSPEFRSKLPPDLEPGPLLLDDFTTLIRQDFDRFGRIIRERNIRI